MKIEQTKIEGLLIIHPQVFGDDRGWFMESFNHQRFAQALEELKIYPYQYLFRIITPCHKGTTRVTSTSKKIHMLGANWFELCKVGYGMWLWIFALNLTLMGNGSV